MRFRVAWACFALLPITVGAQPAAPPATVQEAVQWLAEVRQTELSAARVYRIDGLDIDDEDVHLSLLHGTLGLMSDLNGKLTGAVFEGKGEVLVEPPDAANRSALVNFTGLGVLDEQFSSAYFRFTDGALRRDAADSAIPLQGEAVTTLLTTWAQPVRNLNYGQGLRLLAELLNHGRTPYFFARLSGVHLGTFDVLVDRALAEQVQVSRTGLRDSGPYDDIWLSFVMHSLRTGAPPPAAPSLVVDSYRVRTRIAADLGLSGETTIRFQGGATGSNPPGSTGDRLLLFELSSALHLTRVTDAHGDTLPFVQSGEFQTAGTGAPPSGNQIAVLMPQPLAPGVSTGLRFSYAGNIIRTAGRGEYGVTERADWYPNRGLESATHDLTFTYPKQLTLVASGDPAPPDAADAMPPEGMQVRRWVSNLPLRVAGFNLGAFQVASTTVAASEPGRAPTLVDVYAALNTSLGRQPPATEVPPSPPDPARLQKFAQEEARIIAFYQSRFGTFPYSKLAITQMPYRFGQGWPGLIFLASYAFLTPAEIQASGLSLEAQQLFEALMPAHEIAHQWWGDAVGWNDYHDQWMSEALSNYAALLYLDAQPGARGAAATLLARFRRELLRPAHNGRPYADTGPLTLGLRLNSSEIPDGYNVLIYDKGTWVVHMLRALLRDPAASDPDARFFAALQRFRREFEGRLATTADLQHAFETQLPPALDLTQDGKLHWFFHEWLDSTEVPRYQLADVRWTDEPGRRRVSGTLRQLEVADSFLMSVPLYVSEGATRTALGRVTIEGATAPFSFTTTAAGSTVLVDPEDTILKK